jgi:hypothetical protein
MGAPDADEEVAEAEAASGAGIDIYESLNPQPPTETVTEADDDDYTRIGVLDPYQPKGFVAGPFIALPSVTAATYYDDNVFALPTDELSDWVYVLRPELTLRSNGWQNTDVVATGFVEGRKFDRFESEDQVNGGVGVAGQHLINQNTQIVGRAQYIHGHEERGVSETITTLFEEPIAYDQGEGALALNKRWGRYWASAGGSILGINYEDADLFGVSISQDYRSGDIEKVPVRLGYVVAPLTSVFIEWSNNWRNFDVESFSSDGYRVVGGVLWEPGQGSRVTGEAYAGYMNQDYNGVTMLPVSTWTAGGSVSYLATENVTLTVQGRRDAIEASLSGGVVPDDGVSVVESVAAVRADYRVMPNVVVGGGISYIRDEYKGADRTDDAWSPLASVKYFLNPTFTLGFDYRRVDFDSTGFGVESYNRNVYMFSANARF